MNTSPVLVGYLYGIKAGGWDANDDWCPAHVVAFAITKKTPRRIYYNRHSWGPRPEIRFVDRQRIEADGEIYSHARHWTEPDFHLYLTEPAIEQAAKPDLAQLKAEMTAAHPDRGGSHEAFIAARSRYEKAKR